MLRLSLPRLKRIYCLFNGLSLSNKIKHNLNVRSSVLLLPFYILSMEEIIKLQNEYEYGGIIFLIHDDGIRRNVAYLDDD